MGIMGEFILPVRVYYEDTDSGGVVYYANYLKFMERARTEWLRRLGFEQDRLRDESGIMFAVSRAEVEYRSPARFNDALEVGATITTMGRASLLFQHQIRRAGESPILCSGRVKVACVDAARFLPAPIPRQIIEALGDGE